MHLGLNILVIRRGILLVLPAQIHVQIAAACVLFGTAQQPVQRFLRIRPKRQSPQP